MRPSFILRVSNYIVCLFFSCIWGCDAFAYQLTINPLVQNVFFPDRWSSKGSDPKLVKRVDLYDEMFGETGKVISTFTETKVESVDLDVDNFHAQISVKYFIFTVIVIINEFGRKEALLSGGIDAPFSYASILPFLMNALTLVDISRVINTLYLDTHELPLDPPLTEGASAAKNLGDGEGKVGQEADCENNLVTNSKAKKRKKSLTITIPDPNKITCRRDTKDLSALSKLVRIYTKMDRAVCNNKRKEGWPGIKKMIWEDGLTAVPIFGMGHRVKSIIIKKHDVNGKEQSIRMVVKLTGSSRSDLAETYQHDYLLVTFHQAFNDYLAIKLFNETLVHEMELRAFAPTARVICLKHEEVRCFFPQIDQYPDHEFITQKSNKGGVIFALAQIYEEHTILKKESKDEFRKDLEFLEKKMIDLAPDDTNKGDKSNVKYSESKHCLVCFDVEGNQIYDDRFLHLHLLCNYVSLEAAKACNHLKEAFDYDVFPGFCFEQTSDSQFFLEKKIRSISLSNSGLEIDCEHDNSEEELDSDSAFCD